MLAFNWQSVERWHVCLVCASCLLVSVSERGTLFFLLNRVASDQTLFSETFLQENSQNVDLPPFGDHPGKYCHENGSVAEWSDLDDADAPRRADESTATDQLRRFQEWRGKCRTVSSCHSDSKCIRELV